MKIALGCTDSYMRRLFVGLKMATRYLTNVVKPHFTGISVKLCQTQERLLHTSPAVCTVKSGRVKISVRRNKPVNYENSFPPSHIAHRKSWNSWNTSTIEGGLRPAETAMDDLFIRKFMDGTFPGYIMSKVIIKRQYNMIRIAAVINAIGSERRLCFLIGYTEELLSHWLHCIVKLELQVVNDPKKMIFKYV